jgi:hypothetical protein
MKKNLIVKKILATNPTTSSSKKGSRWKPLDDTYRPSTLGKMAGCEGGEEEGQKFYILTF